MLLLLLFHAAAASLPFPHRQLILMHQDFFESVI
jgi:hypothetical protein